MKSNNVLVKTPRKKTRSNLAYGCAAFFLLVILGSGAFASSGKNAKDVVTPCEVSMPPEAKEADFVVLYKFQTKDGKPVSITKVKNDFLRDDDFTACISRNSSTALSTKIELG